jgi:hypothetical protein
VFAARPEVAVGVVSRRRKRVRRGSHHGRADRGAAAGRTSFHLVMKTSGITAGRTDLNGSGRPRGYLRIRECSRWLECTRSMAGRRSGDGPLSVRTRPSNIKRDSDRRATSAGKSAWSTSHAKSRLTPETPTGTPVRNQGPGRACPGAGGHRQSPMVVNSAVHMVAISLDDLRRSSSLVIALPRVDDCLVPESTAAEGRQP